MKYLAMAVTGMVTYGLMRLVGADGWQATAMQLIVSAVWIATDNVLCKLDEIKARL